MHFQKLFMSSQVIFKIGLLDKSFSANLTDVRFFSAMNHFVLLQNAGGHERTGTNITPIGSFPRVLSHVIIQMITGLVPFSTLRALKRFQLRVPFGVVLQFLLAPVLFVALGTFKVFCAGHPQEMFSESLAVFERLAAVVAYHRLNIAVHTELVTLGK